MNRSRILFVVCIALAMVLVAGPSLVKAEFTKTVTFPPHVHTDSAGNWEAVVVITVQDPPPGWTDPGLHIVGSVNTTTDLAAINGLENTWTYFLSGTLDAGAGSGSVTFAYDPPGEILEETIGIYYYDTRIPTLTEWGMIIFCVLLFGFMAWAIVRRRRKVAVRI